jgi:hypothetical protein
MLASHGILVRCLRAASSGRSFLAMLILGVIVLASFVASFTDWLCMDLLVHRFYKAAPEIWRPAEGAGRIVLSQVIGTMASAAVILLCLLVPGRPLLVAAAVWCAGPLPVILQNLQWIRMEPAVGVGHAAGWLARLLIASGLAACLLPA